jgi:hypothetical protein
MEYRAFQLDHERKATTFRLADLQWAVGQFEQAHGYPPTEIIKHPDTKLDKPYPFEFTENQHLAIGVVMLGPLR